MKVKIEFMTPYKQHIESPQEMELKNGCCLGLLIDKLKDKYPVMKRSFDSEIDRPTITVNNKIIFKMDEILYEGDEIIIFPPVGGG